MNHTYRTLLLIAFSSLLLAVSSCQPKAQYDTIENPMKGFALNANDSFRGAKSIQDLSCDLFLALQGKITFEQLRQFTPDSADIANIYMLTQTPPPSGGEIKANQDSVQHILHSGFLAAQSKAAVLHTDWKDATLTRVMIIEIENQKLPSKKIVLEATDGNTTLRASAKCMKIGERWFIGEDIRYGV
ncbi:MAG TPA: hypothetical protein VE978_23990 [Chitinophagales bacterium]|nr:hypothetical protein [Chitinophagales bacterium]